MRQQVNIRFGDALGTARRLDGEKPCKYSKNRVKRAHQKIQNAPSQVTSDCRSCRDSAADNHYRRGHHPTLSPRRRTSPKLTSLTTTTATREPSHTRQTHTIDTVFCRCPPKMRPDKGGCAKKFVPLFNLTLLPLPNLFKTILPHERNSCNQRDKTA